MSNATFPLTKNLVIPATGNPSKGYLLFPAGEFALSYDVRPQSRKNKLEIILTVEEISTGETAWILGIYEITEIGFPKVINQSEYDKYTQDVASLTASMIPLVQQRATLLSTLAEYPENQSQIDSLTTTIEDYQTQINNLAEVVLQVEYVNKYSDIIQYFNGDGTLTPEGIEWAKQVIFLGEPLSNYID